MVAVEQREIVSDFYIGNTHIKISDEYCRNHDAEEVAAILARIARQAQEVIGAPDTVQRPQDACGEQNRNE